MHRYEFQQEKGATSSPLRYRPKQKALSIKKKKREKKKGKLEKNETHNKRTFYEKEQPTKATFF